MYHRLERNVYVYFPYYMLSHGPLASTDVLLYPGVLRAVGCASNSFPGGGAGAE
jgi:hypothetical protein